MPIWVGDGGCREWFGVTQITLNIGQRTTARVANEQVHDVRFSPGPPATDAAAGAARKPAHRRTPATAGKVHTVQGKHDATHVPRTCTIRAKKHTHTFNAPQKALRHQTVSDVCAETHARFGSTFWATRAHISTDSSTGVSRGFPFDLWGSSTRCHLHEGTSVRTPVCLYGLSTRGRQV